MEHFKTSATFEAKVTKGSTATYHLGFDDCKAQMARCFPNIDSSFLILETSRDGDEGEIKAEAEADAYAAKEEHNPSLLYKLFVSFCPHSYNHLLILSLVKLVPSF